MSDSVRPHRQQPTRLCRPWDSPGKNTGVGCHFLLQCMKVKSESEVTQSCLTLRDPMDCSLPGSSIHGFSRQEYWSGVPLPSPTASDYITSSWRLAGGVLFLPPSDAYVRSFLYLLYTLIKLYYTKALSDQASSLAPDWILLLWRPRIPASFR